MPPLFASYNPHFAGKVIQQAKPRVYPFPRAATYTVGSNGQRLQPTERGNFFLRQNAPAQPQGAISTSVSMMPSGPVNGNGGCGCGCKQ
jgi:hypothetical protein